MIENGLHWIMDMMFRDDECQARTENAPANFTTIKHMALNLIQAKIARQKGFHEDPRLVATWDDDYVASTTTWQVRLRGKYDYVASATTRQVPSGVEFFTTIPLGSQRLR
jgi:hypothetical protein